MHTCLHPHEHIHTHMHVHTKDTGGGREKQGEKDEGGKGKEKEEETSNSSLAAWLSGARVNVPAHRRAGQSLCTLSKSGGAGASPTLLITALFSSVNSESGGLTEHARSEALISSHHLIHLSGVYNYSIYFIIADCLQIQNP